MKNFHSEYDRAEIVRKYRRKTAGYGINYLIPNIYGPIYINNIKELAREVQLQKDLRILEFGCGAAMNLLYLASVLPYLGFPILEAYGTDFSEKMIKAAHDELTEYPQIEKSGFVKFVVASNETIREDLAHFLNRSPDELKNFFHFIFGINTLRFSWPSNTLKQTVFQLHQMLITGGRLLIIDMNNRFPYSLVNNFRNSLQRLKGVGRERSLFQDLWKVWSTGNDLPSLDQYANTLQSVGFKILSKSNFCWIPHSSGRVRYLFFRAITPILDTLIPTRAMRSLIIARKP